MKLKINVGQILLTHPKDENFASVYQESFSRDDTRVDLFVVVEVTDVSAAMMKRHKMDYEKMSRTIVGALKRTYISAPVITEETFEKALANINSSLARLGSSEKITWFGKLNAAIAAATGSQLALSVVGNAVVHLYRQGETTVLSTGLIDEKPKPTKLFANYASGGLANGDRVVIGSRELLNFLSLDRLEQFLSEETLEDSCEEIITALSDIKDTGFATYVFEATTGGKPAPSLERKVTRGRQTTMLANYFDIAKYALFAGAGGVWRGLASAGKFIFHFFKVRPKKYLFVAIAIVLILFFGSIALAAYRKNSRSVKQTQISITSSIEQKLGEAESALLYNNENGAASLVSGIEKLLRDLDKDSPDRARLENTLGSLKLKLGREVRLDNPTVLTRYEGVPTELYRSPNGFLGFNRNSGRLAFYDFRAGGTVAVLQNQNTGSLGPGAFLGSSFGYVFLHKDGKFVKLDPETQTLSDVNTQTSSDVALADIARGKALSVLGQDAGARLYALDHKTQQIWRLKLGDASIGAPERWLKTAADFTEARDLAVDGSVYVLYADHVDKYFNGAKQNFSIPVLTTPLKNLGGIFTTADTQSIYLLDPENKRLVLLSKQGHLQKQILSEKFRELSDIFVDEKAGLLYALAGSELLQISLK